VAKGNDARHREFVGPIGFRSGSTRRGCPPTFGAASAVPDETPADQRREMSSVVSPIECATAPPLVWLAGALDVSVSCFVYSPDGRYELLAV
jgi:hypothetical protein